ncbi:Integral membrane protein [Salinibacterium sp. NYA9b]
MNGYSRTVESSWTALTVLAALWLIAFSAQLADYATARFDDLRLARGVRTRLRLHPVAWIVPTAGLGIVALTIAADWSTRLFFAEPAQAPAAILIALSTVVVAVTIVAIIAVVVVRPPADSYRLVRDELIESAGLRIHQDQVDEFRARVSAIDGASRGRVNTGAGTVSAALQLSVRTPYRLIAPVLALGLVIAAVIETSQGSSQGPAVVIAVIALVASFIIGVSAAQASLALGASVRSTQDVYRGELMSLIVDAERSSKKRVAGLGDRVTRALSILREQQETE